MVITADSGWSERDGRGEPLPAALAAHERAQFALYGLMLLAPLDRGRARLQRFPDAGGLRALQAAHPRAPVTMLFFDADDRLAEAANIVPAPDGGAPVPQRFTFSRETMPGPVRWPRRLSIEQSGRPYFELTLTRFEAVS
jgi:hypothetical protein